MYVDYRVLHFIRDGKPIAFQDVLALWERTLNYEMVETIVDIAVARQMPIWAAEQKYRAEWRQFKQNSPDA